MAKKFYLDTAIWRDYFEDRSDGLRPLGEFAFQFFRKCLESGAELLVSDTVIGELEAGLSKEQVREIFHPFEEIIRKVAANALQVSEARKEWLKRGKIAPFKDVLHASLARDNNAVLVARDRHFFDFLESLVEVKKPEDIRLT
ncbi:MAG: PIN domain-containing protein [Candidatus Diapherotrites archaeon]